MVFGPTRACKCRRHGHRTIKDTAGGLGEFVDRPFDGPFDGQFANLCGPISLGIITVF